MTHRTSADYYAGIPRYGQQQLAAENDRLRSVIERLEILHHVKHGHDSQLRPYVICAYDKTPWPCLTHQILNVEGMNQ